MDARRRGLKRPAFAAGIALALLLCRAAATLAEPSDPLPSWNDGPTKQAIAAFVEHATKSGDPGFVAPAERIATFDQDGTLWVEHPLYTQAVFALDRVRALAGEHPEWKSDAQFKAAIADDRDAIAKFTKDDWRRIMVATNAGMSTDAFQEIAAHWLASAKDPRFHRPYTDLVYQPMLELMRYLRSNGFKTYIVTGGWQEFVRIYSEQVYGVPPEQVVGSSVATRYEMQNGVPTLMREPEIFFVDDRAGKAIGINLFIGRRPFAAIGNADGDREMLEWTGAGKGDRLKMLVLHDDGQREYAYGPAAGLPDTTVGAFSSSLLDEAKSRGWFVISMKRDWKRVFSFEK